MAAGARPGGGRRKPGLRRQFGIDRSGPNPRETRRGQPLRPWTLPNLIGYARLAAIPVFLYLAFGSGDGRDLTAAVLYWCIAAGDYLDGFVARATGQYSRMGAILDPIVDRLTVLAGATVCWHFHLLPRWAIAALAIRELVTVALAEIALRNDLELEISWLGRIAVFAIMSALFWTMVVQSAAWDILFVGGLACAVISTMIYARAGFAHLRATRAA
ncbi:MAG: CDP-alcohol phosphatidyltransferase family protein [Solirubrobacterales bacterium]